MHRPLKEWKAELDKALRTIYYHPTCEFCKQELIFSKDEFDIEMFHPRTVEHEEYEIVIDDNTGDITRNEKKIIKRLESSDPDKDIITVKCPNCGHICHYTRAELRNLQCNYYGDNNIRFTLDDKETQEALDFMKKHDHSEEFLKQGKLGFSTLGQQFTYIITPGGLGSGISIKCNQCHEIKDITNTENW